MENIIIAIIAGIVLLLLIMGFVLYIIFSEGGDENPLEPVPLLKPVPGKPKNISYVYKPVHSPIF